MLWVQPPNDIDFKFSLEIRERFERRLDRDFLSSNRDDRSDLYTRVRPGVELKMGSQWTAVIQYQFAHAKAWKPGPNTVAENGDARDAFIRYAGEDGKVTVGRQKIAIGSERLIGSFEWSNIGRSFDAVRFQRGEWDLFAGKIGVSVPKPRDAEIAAAVHSTRSGQTMLIYKKDEGPAGPLRIGTLSHTRKVVRGALDHEFEVAVQAGESGGLDHRAWAAHGALGYRPDQANRFYVELNGASGGKGTSKSETFDNLYPTNHKFYGSMDMQSWRNMQEIALGWQRKLDAKTDLHLHGHGFRLMDARDAWYGAGGAPNKRAGGIFKDPTGAAGKDVGIELDLEATVRIDPRTIVQAGYGVFDPGSFVERLNGGSADRQTWFFVQLVRHL